MSVGAEPAVQKMRELDEHSIKSGASDASFEAYRFIWERNFDTPVVVSVSLHGRVATLKTHLFPRRSGYSWSEPLPARERTLSRGELRALRHQVALSDFWRLPSSVVEIDDMGPVITVDDSSWTIEAAREGRYHNNRY